MSNNIIDWKSRKYQQDIIQDGINLLERQKKFYLELATGGGKTYIVFQILKYFQPDTIICFSPRKKINIQNINNKYLEIVGSNYKEFNFSIDTDFDTYYKSSNKKIISACIQSFKQIYQKIIDLKMKNVFIWFDESHWAVEETWLPDLHQNDIKKFLLEDKKVITNRLFTSASPNLEIVKDNPEIFGNLLSPIKIKDLIKSEWLCPIQPFIFQNKISADELDFTRYTLRNFTEFNRQLGFSFHNTDKNAFILFYKHYQFYLNGFTDTKPFLLIDESYKNEKLESISLKYNYRNENFFEKNMNSIAYVVKKYDMGYDNKDLDFIIFSDPKMSAKDIKQCIGRGTRSDCLGKEGKNKNKKLVIMIPVFIENEKEDFNKIVQILRYLMLDLDLDIEEIFSFGEGLTKEEKRREEMEFKPIYEGTELVKAQILDLLFSQDPIDTDRLYQFCIKNKIYSERDYNIFKSENPYLQLRDNLYKYKEFKWKNIIDPNNQLYYSTQKECLEAKNKILEMQERIKDENEYDEFLEDVEDKNWVCLNEYDQKIPPYIDLNLYY
jgi:hypothetical protein